MTGATEPLNPADWPLERRIAVVVDTPGWFDPFSEALVDRLEKHGLTARLVRDYIDVPVGDIAFYLSCMKVTPPAILQRNTWNFVVHASDLPKGRGFSPIVWQILEGISQIPVTLIVMTEAVDAGDIVLRHTLNLEGNELNSAIRDALGRKVVEMCFEVAVEEHPPRLTPQTGDATWYKRRTSLDSRLDPDLSLSAQFNLLRTVDNERYPAFFELHGRRFTLLINDVGPALNKERDGK